MSENPGFVFIHGAWHSSSTWDEVIPRLNARGFATDAIDLPGAGPNAKWPESFHQRPLDPQAFASEPSPNAGVTQAERTEAAMEAVKAMAAQTGGKVVLVGHSLGGITVSPTAEAVPDLVAAAVYVSAFMLPPGMPAVAMIQAPEMQDALVPSLFMADPMKVGALRVDFGTSDTEYRERIRQAYCGDLDEEAFARALTHLHCDEPAQVVIVPSPVTKERFGRVPRHYVSCTQDRAVTPAGQRKMIAMMDEAMGTKTVVHELEASHSPFDSRPDALAEILAGIAAVGRAG
jgi:pimeloyl-ACP methyl ester carboxylesterase